MKQSYRRSILCAIAVLTITSLACNLGRALKMAVPPTPTTQASPIPASTEEVKALETQVYAAAATAVSGGPLVLEITEQQFTAAAVTAVQQMENTPITNLQVHLQDGLMQITGDYSEEGLSLPVSVTIRLSVDAEGKPHSEIVSGKIGPMPIPESMLQNVTGQFDRMLVAQFDANAGNMRIESITIADGKLTLVAHPK